MCVYRLKNEIIRQRSQKEARSSPLAGKPVPRLSSLYHVIRSDKCWKVVLYSTYHMGRQMTHTHCSTSIPNPYTAHRVENRHSKQNKRLICVTNWKVPHSRRASVLPPTLWWLRRPARRARFPFLTLLGYTPLSSTYSTSHTLIYTMGLSVSRLLQGLFGKKEMR